MMHNAQNESDSTLFINFSFIQIANIKHIHKLIEGDQGKKGYSKSRKWCISLSNMSRMLSLNFKNVITYIGPIILFAIGLLILPVFILPKHCKQKVF